MKYALFSEGGLVLAEPEPPGFIRPHGGYVGLHCFRKARVIYDATVWFCERHVERYSRTRDQMIQAARSGKQNILEGSQASGTSTETEIRLTSFARASLEELLEDYLDYLRVRGARVWHKESAQALYMRRLGRREDITFARLKPLCESRPGETSANMMICLIHQTNFLLDGLLRRLERDFLRKGGLREMMFRARTRSRQRR
jgi:four helix bundle suffix protein